MLRSGEWWFDVTSTNGISTDPSVNADMISLAFWLVGGNELKITRSDDANHTALLQSIGSCLGGMSFRQKMASYGNFRLAMATSGEVHGGQVAGVLGRARLNMEDSIRQRGVLDRLVAMELYKVAT